MGLNNNGILWYVSFKRLILLERDPKSTEVQITRKMGKEKLLPKNEEISGGKARTNLRYFYHHSCLSQSEESKCILTQGKDGAT
jgi:hypothetical protein